MLDYQASNLIIRLAVITAINIDAVCLVIKTQSFLSAQQKNTKIPSEDTTTTTGK